MSRTLTPETMKLLGSTKIWKRWKCTTSWNTAEVVLIHCNIVNKDFKQESRVWYTFVPNRSIGQLRDISPKKNYILKNS